MAHHGQFETVLRIITIFVVIAGLLGMLTSIISTLNERRREMAISVAYPATKNLRNKNM